MLKALARVDLRNQYYLYYGASFRQSRAALPHFDNPNFHKKLIRFPGRVFRLLTEKLRVLPVGSLLGDYDLYHGMNYHVPRVAFPSIVNIYDLSYLLFPQYFTRKRLNDIRGKVASSIKRADRILTGSESTKADIVNFLKVQEERIEVIQFGVEEAFKPQGSEEAVSIRKKLSLPERFILFVGTIEPRKNIISLLRAYRKLGRSDIGLVVAGGRGWLFEEIFREVGRLNLHGKVLFPGRVSEADLPALYSAASVFVYPSVYEGFGFPPLEAMACGTPVITSNTSSLPEIVGDAGIRVNPEDSGGIAEAIGSVLDDNSKRDEMRMKGIERAKRFSWETCARKTLRLYREVAG
jgi:glycosyltransferase involved in cell wall biosynthesis